MAQTDVSESETGKVRLALTREQRELQSQEVGEIVRLYADGMSLTAIGERYGAHRQTIKRHLLGTGVAVRDEFVNARYRP